MRNRIFYQNYMHEKEIEENFIVWQRIRFWLKDPSFDSIKYFLTAARFYRELLFLQAYRNESRVVRCKFRVFQRRRIFRSELSRGHRLSRARFRRIFISRARKSSAECSFRSGKRMRKKDNFSARREITFTAQKGGSYLSHCRNLPEETAMISLTSRTTRPTKCDGGCEYSFTSFLFFVYRLFALLGLSLMFIFLYYVRNNYAEEIFLMPRHEGDFFFVGLLPFS